MCRNSSSTLLIVKNYFIMDIKETFQEKISIKDSIRHLRDIIIKDIKKTKLKQMNNSQDKSKDLTPNNDENLSYLRLFSNGDHFLYNFKKTEKIVQAIHIATAHFEPNEPLKFELREKSLSFLSHAFAMNSFNSYDRSSLLQSFFATSFEIISLIRISMVSGHISSRNSQILQSEIESMISVLKSHLDKNDISYGLILSKDFFATDIPKPVENDKGQNLKNTQMSLGKSLDMKPQQKDKKNQRQHDILEMLKRQPHLTIKDFTRVIHGCSEKTIQRELIELVEKGVIKREGERRWSRYSLK